jgi:transcriptional regulator with XRE-family HTH domain
MRAISKVSSFYAKHQFLQWVKIMDISNLLRTLKSEYGLNQAKLAARMNISPQILTDLKAGRRRFNRKMAETILSLFADEPSAGWLAGELEGILAESEYVRNFGIHDAGGMPDAGVRLPVLDALCAGDPLAAHGYSGETVLIPESLASFVRKESAAYVFVLDYDDCSGRLRAGDQILIVQNLGFTKEIMVVEHVGRLRLARKGWSESDDGENPCGGKETPERWLTLDTGKPLDNVAIAGAAVGIVAAKL